MSLFSSLSVSASGMAAQRTRASLLVENLANAETTRTPEGGPYRRKDVVFAPEQQVAAFADAFQAEMGGAEAGVRVDEVIEDTREPIMRYQPGHPDANEEGYVAFPRVNPAEDMVDLMSASRGYEANVAAMSAIKNMISRSIELLR
jgi:flagellar basal-body rod protein FlgC